MRLHRGLLAALLGLLLLVSGCTSFTSTVAGGSSGTSPASQATSAPAAPITWSDCTDQIKKLVAGQPGADRDLSFSCGRTDVPIDYAHPSGSTLPLFLLRARLAGQTARIGSLVVNPGGPGASGADAALGLSLTLPTDVLQRFDLVGFDPRGVGLSTPVKCIPDDLKDTIAAAEPRPTTDAQITAAFALDKKLADGCAKKYGKALGTFNTVDTARDMDRIRQALGDAKINYLGYSYGTTLGSTYAELFPKNIRTFVLDGVVDPDTTPVADAEASAAGLEKGFDDFAANCVHLPSGCPVGADPRGFVEALLTQADQAPIPSAKQGETRKATAGIVLTAVLSAMYDTQSWPQLAQSLAAAQKGDSQGLFSLADSYDERLDNGTYSNLMDANIAINCADTDQKVSESEIRTLAGEWRAKYPLFGAGNAVGLYTCDAWQADRTPLPKRKAVDTPQPILVVGNTGDPVTPFAGAQDMRKDLRDAVLLTWQGEGHTSYPKTPCVAKAVDSYLLDATAPMDGLTCPAQG